MREEKEQFFLKEITEDREEKGFDRFRPLGTRESNAFDFEILNLMVCTCTWEYRK